MVIMADSPKKLWEHADASSTSIEEFRRQVNREHGLNLQTYHDLWKWSTEHTNDFWMHLWRFTRVVAQVTPKYAITEEESKRLIPRAVWFPKARLNFAQNLLESPYVDRRSRKPILTSIREGGTEIAHYDVATLQERAAHLANALRHETVKRGDVVACIGTNSADTFIIFMATAAVGAIFTSCSPETGEKGILDRLTQVRPKILFAEDAILYNGKRTNCLAKAIAVSQILETGAAFRRTVIVSRFHDNVLQLPSGKRFVAMRDFLHGASGDVLYEGLRFDDPLLIVYSSGTTGQPKCIVHTVGGVLLKQKLEQILCTDMAPGSVHLQYSTTNWIMYLYTISGMLSGTRSILYDGSPMQPGMTSLIDLLAKERVTHFGTSAHYLQLLQQGGHSKDSLARLPQLKVITSTGSVLTESQYFWIYETFGSIQLSSIAGGTDIAGAFVGGAPNIPVYAGECQARTLGMKVQIYSEDGTAIEDSGQPGELVCTAPFPSQPAYFWNDNEGARYKSAYFEQFKGVWTQGDFIRMNPKTQGIYFLGRSDGVLNPSGVRFGSAEIYNCLKVFQNIEDSLCIGQRRPSDHDERVLLFVKMQDGHKFTDSLREAIRQRIRSELSPRHVPAYCFETPAIPMTVNGKKTEIPVKKIVSGQKVVPSSTIVNPESLEWYEQFAKLEEVTAPAGQRKSKL